MRARKICQSKSAPSNCGNRFSRHISYDACTDARHKGLEQATAIFLLGVLFRCASADTGKLAVSSSAGHLHIQAHEVLFSRTSTDTGRHRHLNRKVVRSQYLKPFGTRSLRACGMLAMLWWFCFKFVSLSCGSNLNR